MPTPEPVPIDLRLRSWIPQQELDAKVGKIVTSRDWNVLVTGPVRLFRPSGELLAVFLPGVLAEYLAAAYPTLTTIRGTTDNRGAASGTPRQQRGDQKRTRTRPIMSSIIGAVDPGPSSSKAAARLPVCRLTAWTGKHLPEWEGMQPVFQAIARQFERWVPDRYAVQRAAARRTPAEWVIPETPFTTVTVNNTYSTGVHQDAGDLKEGFSTLAVCRRGAYAGGQLCLPRYRVAFDLHDGDLLLFDAHEWHGNAAMHCGHVDGALARPCPQGCERISLVTYFRTKVQQCGTAEEEAKKATEVAAAGYGA